MSRRLGAEPMPWQQLVSDVANELDEHGRRFYRTVVVTLPRQQGKTMLTLPTWVERAISWPGASISWTMQTAQDARDKWLEEHVPALQASPELWPLVEDVRKQNGSEHCRFVNGSLQNLLGSRKTSGHGRVVDLGMVDEAMAQHDDRLHQSLRPAMKTRNRAGLPGAQLWIISTQAPFGEGEWFAMWVDAGRAAVEQGTCEQDRICFFEWSAPYDADPGDPAVWWGCMPALGYTITEDTVAAEYREALLLPDGLAGFRRQALNQRTSQRADPPIPLALWDRCEGDAEQPKGGCVWAVDVSPEQASAAIAVAWMRPDGVPHVSVADHRDGVGWLPGRVSELRDRWGGVWLLDPRGGSGSQASGWPGVLVAPGDARRACAELEAAVRSGGVGHDGQQVVRVALEGAVKRPSEDGGWGWARRSTAVDISPLVALSLALFGVRGGLKAEPVEPFVVMS